MKKLLLLLTFTSLCSFSIEKPKLQVGGAIAYSVENGPLGTYGADASIYADARWNYNIYEKLDLTYGARGSFDLAVSKKDNQFQGTHLSLVASGLVGLEYDIKEDLDLYTELELGIGPRLLILPNTKEKIKKQNVSRTLAGKYVGKIALGVKYKQFKAGLYTGYGKGNIGLELGYTF